MLFTSKYIEQHNLQKIGDRILVQVGIPVRKEDLEIYKPLKDNPGIYNGLGSNCIHHTDEVLQKIDLPNLRTSDIIRPSMIEHTTLAKIFMWMTSVDHKIVEGCFHPEEVSKQERVDLDRIKFIGFDDEGNMPRYMIMPFTHPEPYAIPPLIGEELRIDGVD